MRFVMFYHSLISDWNHGNAHFLRGIVRELKQRGHEVHVYEPVDAWSVENLLAEKGPSALTAFTEAFPGLASTRYDAETIDLTRAVDGADVVIVHEWNEPELVARLGLLRRSERFVLLFHDTHHRAVTRPDEMDAYDLREYDGVLAFGDVIRSLYIDNGWTQRAWTWHEAADTALFHPLPRVERKGDLIWIGNWGDDERTEEIRALLIEPAAVMKLKARVHGVRYPEAAVHALRAAGIEYEGWIPNHLVPRAFSQFRATVHIPRRPYVEALPGIPTIRVFEALACGIPLVSAPWNDAEHLFTPGEDFLVAADTTAMTRQLRTILSDPDRAAALTRSGLKTIRERHTCAHRAEELLDICAQLGAKSQPIQVWAE